MNKILDYLNKGISDLHPYEPGRSIDDVIAEYKPEKVVKLASNENPLGASPKAIKALEAATDSLHLYPDGDSKNLKLLIAKHESVDIDNIIIGNGSNEVLELAARAFLNKDSSAVMSKHAFAVYKIVTQSNGSKIIEVPTTDWKHSLDDFSNYFEDSTRICFIANPNNPTGSIIFKKELIKFLDKVPSTIIVVLDGAYSEFIKDKSYTDGVDLVNKYKNLIITRTFSKIFGLAGLRLGWGYSNKEIINLMERIRGPFNVNLIAQHIGSLILKDNEFLKKSIDHNEKWRHYLPKKLNELGFKVKTSYTNFVLVEVDKKKHSKEKILNILKKNKIIVRDMKSYNLQNFFRVSIGRDSHMKKFLKVLKSSLDK